MTNVMTELEQEARSSVKEFLLGGYASREVDGVGRVYVAVIPSNTAGGVRRHTRNLKATWKLNGKRIAAAKLAAILR
jgi:hypothetical protein